METFPALPRCAALALAAALAGCASALATNPSAAPAAVESLAANVAPAPSQTGAPTRPPATATATTPPAATPAATPSGASASAAGPRPFAEVIKDAKSSDGLFRVWTKDERTWIEIQPEQFGKLYFLKSNLNQGIGEARLFGGMMDYPAGLAQPVELRRSGTLVQLVARNLRYFAKPGTPEARAVAAGFSDSLLASAAVVSQPHPERKSVLIDAGTVFLADLPGAALVLERVYRQAYAFDARNSTLARATAAPDMVTFEVSAHYGLARPARPQPGSPPGPGTPTLPSTLPDVRSLFLGFHYTLAKLPDEPMRPRIADERIGYFTTELLDFTTDVPRVPVTRYVNRWRLEKLDPAAELSEPVRPIVFWLDRNIPEKYRAPVRAGILEWNKAFERIGFKDAIRVLQQPDDANFDTSDLGRASVRWITAARTSFGAIGPTVVDPRTGEILDADIGIDATNVRVVRNLRSEFVPRAPAPPTAGAPASRALACEYDEKATGEAVFGLALLEARGDLDPEGPDVERFVAAFLKDTTMHEVGHTLGLRHNFRASTVYGEEQLADPAFTRANGIAGSVMEYNPWNIALRGAAQGDYQMSTLGPYDYWAIEYAYRPLAPADEAAGLAAIAARSSEPLLAFATDEDAGASSLDPQNNQLDLGRDPLAFAHKRFALVRELLRSTEAREMKAGEGYAVLRRNFARALGEASQAALYAAKYIGGLTTLRDRAGTGRDPLTPVPAEKQRAALQLIASQVFSADSFRFSPAFLRRMAVSSFDIDDAIELGRSVPSVDLSIDQQVLAMQRQVLGTLMGESVAQRLVNNEAKVDDPARALRLPELYATLHAAVWSELPAGRDIPLARRNLQRDYALRLAGALTRPAASMPADARSLLRADAVRLRGELARAKDRTGLSEEARAHLAESLAVVDEALKAPLVRQAV
ncbi:MAG: zinc-dependent metalloprotease [Betaproteobacteria bacterium]|nr:zinc-dependent metalloprotease [Betaproteobacteria bacterium]